MDQYGILFKFLFKMIYKICNLIMMKGLKKFRDFFFFGLQKTLIEQFIIFEKAA